MNTMPGADEPGLAPASFPRAWRRAALSALLVILALHSLRTLGCYLLSDDILWLRRTVADSRRPWNAFIEPLFGDYYRPVPHLLWLANYYLFGFSFGGHQLMFILLWLGSVALVYVAGVRIGGPAAGIIAAAVVACSDIYLVLVSWKSWYTTLAEFAAVLAWFVLFARWAQRPAGRGRLAWVIVAGVAAVLCRELAPLIISGVALVVVVLPRLGGGASSRRGGILFLVAWLAMTAAVLLLLPSCRSGVAGIIGAGVSAGRGGTPQLVLERFESHTRSMFSYGLTWHLLTVALALSAARRLGQRGFLTAPALVLAATVLALVALARGRFMFFSGAAAHLDAGLAALILAAFLLLALTDDAWNRALAAWFVAAFAPILFLEHGSNSYHLLAYAALALYAAREVSRFMARDALPALAAQAGPARRATLLVAVVVCAALAQQAVLSVSNLFLAAAPIRARVALGQGARRAVAGAVVGTLEASRPDRRVWVAGDGHEWVAALMLQVQHGYSIERIRPWEQVVGLRTFDSPLRLYPDAIPFDPRVFEEENLATAGAGEARVLLREDQGYVFGGWLESSAQAGGARLELRSALTPRYGRRTPAAPAQAKPEFRWECFRPASAGGTMFTLTPVAERRGVGRVAARELFICPVTRLIERSREGKP